MPDYQQGKIYTIRCRTDDTLIYVGSTTQPLCKRLYEHKIHSKIKLNSLIYRTINGEWDNWYIELYELYPCSCRNELERKEGEIIRLIGTLNNNIAGRTEKEYYNDKIEKILNQKKTHRLDNIDKYKEKDEIYYNKNKDKINEYKKKKITCECGCEIRIYDLNRHRKSKKHIYLINKNLH